MKIIRNIPQVIKIYRSLRYLNEYKKEIDSGRFSGDMKKEKEKILKATKTWGSKLSEMIGVEITDRPTTDLFNRDALATCIEQFGAASSLTDVELADVGGGGAARGGRLFDASPVAVIDTRRGRAPFVMLTGHFRLQPDTPLLNLGGFLHLGALPPVTTAP